MYRVRLIMCRLLCVLCLLLCASGCVSARKTAQRRGQAGEPSLPAQVKKNGADVRSAARLLPELVRAVGAYDVQKATALFETIAQSCGYNEDNALLIAARERMQPLYDAITIEPLGGPAGVSVGSPFEEPFTARVIVTAPEKRFALAHFPVTAAYPSGEGYGAQMQFKTEALTTDADGLLSFMPPVPVTAVQGELYFYIPYIGAARYGMRAHGSPTEVPANLRTSFPYKAATTEKKIPTIIAILDYDEHNQPVFSNNITATRTLAGLMKRGFSRIGLDEYRELAEAEEVQVIQAAEDKIGSGIERLVFGKTYITVQPSVQGGFTCRIRADISVWNFKQAQKTHQAVFEYSAEAKTEKQAVYRARTELGEHVIAEAFQYGF